MKSIQGASSVSARFAAASKTYDTVSGAQKAVAEKLSAFLPPPVEVDSVLEIGCGTGHLTELLVHRFPLASIDAVDISGPMTDSARERIGNSGRVCFHVADARRFRPGGTFSLVASSSALHWITPAEEIMDRIAATLKTGGNLVSALMVEGTLGELGAARASLFPHKSAPVRLPAVEEILSAIAGAGLTLERYRFERLRQTCGSARELLHSLNRQGVTGRPESGSRLLNRTELLALTDYYDRHFAAPEGGVAATYCVLYLTARKKR